MGERLVTFNSWIKTPTQFIYIQTLTYILTHSLTHTDIFTKYFIKYNFISRWKTWREYLQNMYVYMCILFNITFILISLLSHREKHEVYRKWTWTTQRKITFNNEYNTRFGLFYEENRKMIRRNDFSFSTPPPPFSFTVYQYIEIRDYYEPGW